MATDLRRLWIAMIVLYGITLAVVLTVGWFSLTIHSSLCSFRGDLENRRDSTLNYLTARNKNGMLVYPGPIFGVPRSVIAANVRNQTLALNSISGLRC